MDSTTELVKQFMQTKLIATLDHFGVKLTDVWLTLYTNTFELSSWPLDVTLMEKKTLASFEVATAVDQTVAVPHMF